MDLTSSEDIEPLSTAHSSGKNTTLPTYNPVATFLILSVLLLLTYGHHTQGKNITQLSQKLAIQ
jgi:hypothetical protein